MATDLLHIDRELADRLVGIEQIEDAVTRGDAADFGRRIDEPALSRHVRDRVQLGARTDRALERGAPLRKTGLLPYRINVIISIIN
jgi:hypothetical protein